MRRILVYHSIVHIGEEPVRFRSHAALASELIAGRGVPMVADVANAKVGAHVIAHSTPEARWYQKYVAELAKETAGCVRMVFVQRSTNFVTR